MKKETTLANVPLRNRDQKTLTVGGKRRTASELLALSGGSENKAGNIYISSFREMHVTADFVMIRESGGDFVRVMR